MQLLMRSPTRRTPMRAVALLAACAALVAAGTWILRPSAPPRGSETPDTETANLAAPAVDAPGTDGLLPPDERVAFWEARVADGGAYLDHIHLADAYIDRARASGDLADLRRAETALASAAETAPDLAVVRVREALVAFALHDFRGALGTATGVLETAPSNLTALTVAADSLLELGDIDAAAQRYEQLAEIAPSAASWSRLGRLAFLHGDLEGATALVAQAADSAVEAGFPDEIAFYQVQLGDLHRTAGALPDAEAAYAAALRALPDHAPASAGLARVREAQGRRDEAIVLLESAVNRLPVPEQMAALGDLHALNGDAAAAEDRYALVEAIAGLEADVSVYDRAFVLFAADHERRPTDAISAAQAQLETRTDVYAYDALAWALFAAGRIDEASIAAAEATRLGTADPRIAYHAGMIAAADGRPGEARTLLERAVAGSAALPPLQVPRAEAALANLND